jgi:hypothetical protein
MGPEKKGKDKMPEKTLTKTKYWGSKMPVLLVNVPVQIFKTHQIKVAIRKLSA